MTTADRTLVALGNEHALQVLQVGKEKMLVLWILAQRIPFKIHEMKLRKLSQVHNRGPVIASRDLIITDRQALQIRVVVEVLDNRDAIVKQ